MAPDLPLPGDPLLGTRRRERLGSVEAAAVAGIVCAVGWSIGLRGLLAAPGVDATDLGSGFVPGADGTVTLDPAVAKDCLYNDCDEATAQWALERLGPQRLASLGDSPTRVAWRTRPSTYLVCAADRTVHPDLQRILARRCGATIEWPTGHSPFLSDPKRVADLLVGIVDMVNIAGPDEGA